MTYVKILGLKSADVFLHGSLLSRSSECATRCGRNWETSLRNAPRKILGRWLPRSALSRPIRELLGGLAAAARPVAPAIAGRGKPRPYRTSRGRTLLGLRFFDDEVSFVSAGGNDSAAENFGDNARWIAGTVHAVFSELIGGQALRIERAEARSRRETAGGQSWSCNGQARLRRVHRARPPARPRRAEIRARRAARTCRRQERARSIP